MLISIIKKSEMAGLRVVIFLLFGVLSSGYAQTHQAQKDSLLHLISVGSDIEKVNAGNELGMLNIGNTDSANYYYDFAYELSLQINYKKGIADAFFLQGRNLHFLGDNSKALKKYNQALDIYMEIDDKSAISNCLIRIGLSYQAQSKYSSALQSFNRVLEFDDSIQIANSYTNMGMLQNSTGNHTKALDYFYKSIAICESNNYQTGIAYNYLGIAFMHFSLKDFDKTILFLKKAQKKYNLLDNEVGYIKCVHNLGVVYLNIGETEKAIDAFKESLVARESKLSNDDIASISINLSEAYLKLENFSLAKEYYKKAKVFSEGTDDKLLACDVLYLGAQISQKSGYLNKALVLYNQSLEVATGLTAWDRIVKASWDLKEIYKTEGNYEQAVNFIEIYINAFDSLINVEKVREIEQLKFSYEVVNMEKELALQRAEIKLFEKEKLNIRLTNIILFSGSFLIVVFVMFSFFRQRKINRIQNKAMISEKAFMNISLEQEKLKSQQLDDIVIYKNKQLTDLAIHITEKNDLLEKFKLSIKSVRKKIENKKVKEQMQEILIQISLDIDMNKERLVFYKEIETLNQSFLYNLSQQFSDLTDRELKLAALLRVNLTSKQIATLMGITPKSTDVYRHNLRKKLRLRKDEVLSEFFKNMG